MTGLVTALVVVLVTGSGTVWAQECLHGPSATPDDRLRRRQALEVADAINMAQTTIVGPRTPAPRYRPLEELLNIPPLPPGFDLQFLSDGERYSFSLKDTSDPCRYAIFSDQDTRVYEAVPQVRPRALPLASGR